VVSRAGERTARLSNETCEKSRYGAHLISISYDEVGNVPTFINLSPNGWCIVSPQITTPAQQDFIKSWYRRVNLKVSRSLSILCNVWTSDATDTEWVRIVDTGQKNVDGKTLGEILIDILEKFPSYDLLSEEGVAEASQDIEASLSPVALFREMRRDVGARSEHNDTPDFGQ
jgi:hypothetical protein